MTVDERIAELLRYDFSQGHEDVRDRILARCLALLDEDGAATPPDPPLSLVDDSEGGDGRELRDEELLAVAGGVAETDTRGGKSLPQT